MTITVQWSPGQELPAPDPVQDTMVVLRNGIHVWLRNSHELLFTVDDLRGFSTRIAPKMVRQDVPFAASEFFLRTGVHGDANWIRAMFDRIAGGGPKLMGILTRAAALPEVPDWPYTSREINEQLAQIPRRGFPVPLDPSSYGHKAAAKMAFMGSRISEPSLVGLCDAYVRAHPRDREEQSGLNMLRVREELERVLIEGHADLTEWVDVALAGARQDESIQEALNYTLAMLVNGMIPEAFKQWELHSDGVPPELGRHKYTGASGCLNGIFDPEALDRRQKDRETWAQLASLADLAWAARLSHNLVVWHGFGPAAQGKVRELLKGSPTQGHGFFSTSLSQTEAIKHVHRSGSNTLSTSLSLTEAIKHVHQSGSDALCRILVNRGQTGLFVSGTNEGEIILPPGTELRPVGAPELIDAAGSPALMVITAHAVTAPERWWHNPEIMGQIVPPLP